MTYTTYMELYTYFAKLDTKPRQEMLEPAKEHNANTDQAGEGKCHHHDDRARINTTYAVIFRINPTNFIILSPINTTTVSYVKDPSAKWSQKWKIRKKGREKCIPRAPKHSWSIISYH